MYSILGGKRMKKQTAVEWLLDQLEQKGDMRETPCIRNLQLNIDTSDYLELKRQAKEMHKQEIEKVSGDWWNEGASYMYDGKREYNSFEQYYKETFVSKGSDDKFDVEKEMFELEQQLDIPSNMRWHNRKPKETLYTEEQVRKAICTAWYEGAEKRYKGFTMVSDTEVDEIIQSLKQPKQ
jgi:hypothetical protein